MELIQTILGVIASREDGMTKTLLMYKSFTSYIQLVECLAILRRSGHIEYDPLMSSYRITQRDLRLVQVTKEINEFVTT
jgi:predicted transcriptional regulator